MANVQISFRMNETDLERLRLVALEIEMMTGVPVSDSAALRAVAMRGLRAMIEEREERLKGEK